MYIDHDSGSSPFPEVQTVGYTGSIGDPTGLIETKMLPLDANVALFINRISDKVAEVTIELPAEWSGKSKMIYWTMPSYSFDDTSRYTYDSTLTLSGEAVGGPIYAGIEFDTPNTAGTYMITVRVTDKNGTAEEKQFPVFFVNPLKDDIQSYIGSREEDLWTRPFGPWVWVPGFNPDDVH